MRNLLIYHYPCPDGVFSALSAQLYFSTRHPTDEIVYMPSRITIPYEASSLDLRSDDAVFFMDFTSSAKFVTEVAARVASVVVLDHHLSSMQDMEAMSKAGPLPANLDVRFNMEKSGAGICFDYFSNLAGSDLLPDASATKRLQRVMSLVEDNDLYRHAIFESKAFATGFGDLKLEFDARLNPGIWDKLLSLDPDEVIQRGTALEEEKARLIEAELQKAFVADFGDKGRVLGVQTGADGSMRSDLGNALATESKKRGMLAVGLVAYTDEGVAADHIKVSFRSLKEADTLVFTRSFGGGGHQCASSCVVPLATFSSWVVPNSS
eukprot:gnl/Hemi2/23493_TR7869_c0_g1_i1.p1 gnl/Hemi2/23493_TR7869_c0_g1~~gnl/Hemi2/23493_TR7869_c0_g1_i1.p1  ORF type:complete len:356 (+),score=95.81 gnl/Hemi2/23493_TR7869_c0_g1_i1:103-1068(+)